MDNCQSGINSGTIILSFLTGIAAGVAAALLYDASKDKTLGAEDHEDQLFI